MFTTRTEAWQATVAAIESGGAVDDAQSEFVIDAIVDAAYEYSSTQQAFVQTVGTEDFWKLVETHAIDTDPSADDTPDAASTDAGAGGGETQGWGGDDQTLDEVLAAHEAVAEAERLVTERVAERAETVTRAMAAGVGVRRIAEALGVDRSRVYRIAARNYADRRRQSRQSRQGDEQAGETGEGE